MDKLQRIFVAIDFSPMSDEALRQAHTRATSTGAKLAVCHVVPNDLRSNVLFPDITRTQTLRVPLTLERLKEGTAVRVAEITRRAPEEYDLIVDEGIPYSTILTCAENWLADLIVVGSHGAGAALSGLLGSVTSKIVRYAHCPVLVVRDSGHKAGIVAGTDFSDPALPALRAAVSEARRTGAQLTVVHSLDVTWTAASYPAMAFGGAPVSLTDVEIRAMESAAEEKLRDVLQQLDIAADILVARGPAAAALVETASQLKSGLLVVGTLGRTGLRRVLLGSVAEAVVTQAPCSVLVVRLHPG